MTRLVIPSTKLPFTLIRVLGNWPKTTIFVQSKIRRAHTDLPRISFQEYRRKTVQDPNVSSARTIDERRTTTSVSSFGMFLKLKTNSSETR